MTGENRGLNVEVEARDKPKNEIKRIVLPSAERLLKMTMDRVCGSCF
jgi:hypothetical protein